MSSTTICMTDTSVIPFPTLDLSSAQTSNTAAGPLPHIPCRNTRSSPPLTFSDTSVSDSTASEPCDNVDYPPQTHSPTYVRYDSGSSSSSSTPSDEIRPTIIPRSKRIAPQHSTALVSRDITNPVSPPSTPVKRPDKPSFMHPESRRQTPLRDSSDDEDIFRPFPVLRQAPFFKVGKLRLEGSAGKHVRQASDSDLIASRPQALGSPNPDQLPKTIRKKSGQPIKSSLKSARRPELHIVTSGSLAKSEPATPTHTKAVHFDSKLEHVKLFLAEQKPLAVSRDGSPTSDTSGDEFPSFIYGNGGRQDRYVKMLLPNMPASPNKEQIVALQGLVLSQDQRTITGHVRVRNITFEKWLAIRFTLDWWQTTSEVTARHDKSVDNGAFDMFTFTIRLHDIWSRIEEKTIFIALRYIVAGQEHWDNNAGNNYHIKFALAPCPEPSSAVDNETSLRDLNSRLEDLVQSRSAPIPITPNRIGRSFSADYQHSSFIKSSSSRYSFASAYKTQWARNTPPSSNHHTRTHTYPSGVPTTAGPTVAPWSKTSTVNETERDVSSSRLSPAPRPPGSPPEVKDGTPTLPARSETKLASPDSPSPTCSPDGRERNHRRSFIDRTMERSPNLRRTPIGSPLKFGITDDDTAGHLPRTRSYPLTGEKPGPMGHMFQQLTLKPPLSIQTAPVGSGGSEEPTPYAASQSSSSSNSSSTPLFSPSSDFARSDTSYKQFLDQFCFYTGADDSLPQESSECLPRSQSTSSIEHYLLSHSPPQSFSSGMREVPARFPFDSSLSTSPATVRV